LEEAEEVEEAEEAEEVGEVDEQEVEEVETVETVETVERAEEVGAEGEAVVGVFDSKPEYYQFEPQQIETWRGEDKMDKAKKKCLERILLLDEWFAFRI
jgi:hypothetical protein